MGKRVLALLFISGLAAALLAAGCSRSPTGTPGSSSSSSGTPAAATPRGTITVGSKIDTEGKLLGEMIVLALKNAGLEVKDKTEFGTTDVVRKALLNGEIDIYPEYTGSGLVFFKDQDPAVFKDAQKGYDTDKALDLAQNKVMWLAPAKANNTWALAIRKEFADRNSLKTMSDFAAYVKGGGAVKLAASDEFFTNAGAWPMFARTYGLDIPAAGRVVLAGGNTSQTEKAVASGTDGVNVGMAYGTDGGLADLGLAILADDKGAQVVYWPTPTLRGEAATRFPEIAVTLDPIFSSLTLEKLQELNGRIQVKGEAATAVAKDYLVKNGFLKQ